MTQLSSSNEVSDGAKGRPFASATFDLAEHGYVEEEWFLRGDASTYGPARDSSLGGDGHWSVVATGSEEFCTRLLVRRPTDPARSDGTVVLEWFNVSGGIDLDPVWAQSHVEIMRDGNTWVGVSAQRAGVNGPPLMAGFSQPLELWDPGRYRELHIPNDDLSYGIFTAAARMARDGALTAQAPVDVVVAAGASQSANRLVTYVNAVHPLVGAIDGFLVHGRVGTSSPPLAADVVMPDPLTFRTDSSAPVVVLESEFDTLRSWLARQPDSERFRLWEVAGSTHQDEYVERTLKAQFARDLGHEMPGCDCAVNDMPFHYVENAALAHLRGWARGGGAAPQLPRISMNADGEIDRDEHGNALGGIRLPHIVVPTAQYGPVGTPQSCALRGFVKPFPPEKFAALYPTRDDYLACFDAAADEAVAGGFLLEPDAREARELN
ncbi:MAG: alpha/beta hydrolase domain-containing protein [Acidimicrobiia bacterium]